VTGAGFGSVTTGVSGALPLPLQAAIAIPRAASGHLTSLVYARRLGRPI